MYVCMYVCVYVRMYAYMYVCMYVCMHICMCVCMYLCMYARVHAFNLGSIYVSQNRFGTYNSELINKSNIRSRLLIAVK